LTKPKSKPPLRPLPLAVIVRSGDDAFSELLRTVRSKVDVENTGTIISKMRETRNGSLLIEINSDTESADLVKAEIERSMGPGASVMKTGSNALIELRHLDGMTNAKNVAETIVRESIVSLTEVNVLNIRWANGGFQAATVPAVVARLMCQVGRLRVGLVYSRVGLSEGRTRCYRCFAFGHESRDYQGVDQSQCCWRCGNNEYFAKDCKAEPGVVNQFKSALENLGDKIGISPSSEPVLS